MVVCSLELNTDEPLIEELVQEGFIVAVVDQELMNEQGA